MQKAAEWFLSSARHGCADGQNNFGLLLWNGTGVDANAAEARSWFRRAVDNGVIEARVNLGLMLERGEGGPVDYAGAAELYGPAAKRGLIQAIEGLRRANASGAVGPEQVKLAGEQLRKAALDGDRNSLLVLGRHYHEGTGGLPQDDAQAEQMWERAAALGQHMAQLELGRLLLRQRKNERAFPWILKAAESSLGPAQALLARLYDFGHGCARDAVLARRWQQRSELQREAGSDPDEGAARIGRGEALCAWERANGLGDAGLGLDEREMRYLRGSVPLAAHPSLARVLDSFEWMANAPAPTLRSGGATSMSRDVRCLPALWKRACEGSETARGFFRADRLVSDARRRLEAGGDTEAAFALLTRAYYEWELMIFCRPDIAAFDAAASADAAHPDALFWLARSPSNGAPPSERRIFLERCVLEYPSRAEFHHLLGCIWGFLGDHRAARRELERAVELRPEPDWYYSLASSLRLALDKRPTAEATDEAIAAYERFLSLNQPDHRKVPEAHYSIALLHVLYKRDRAAARRQYALAQASEDPSVRLPCFEPVSDNFPPKRMTRELLALAGEIPPAPPPPTDRCAACNRAGAANKCPCDAVRYCGRECQKMHWKDHKLACTSRKR